MFLKMYPYHGTSASVPPEIMSSEEECVAAEVVARSVFTFSF